MVSEIFSPVNLVTFVLRLVLFFVFIGLLILIFIGFQEIAVTSEDSRAANSLAESLMASSLTEGKAVFSLAGKMGGFSLDDLNGNNVELPRYCDYGALFKLRRLRDGKEWKWGYAAAESPEAKKYLAWVKDGSTEHALLSVSIKRDQVTQLACAIERAYAFKDVQEFELQCHSSTCIYARQDQNFCISQAAEQACRWLPDIPIEGFSFESVSSKIYVVPIKRGGSSSCARGEVPSGAFRTAEDRANFDVEKIAFCLR
jgi:hypothetical protein